MQAEEFGKYLRQLREDRGLTIRQVEAFSGVSNSYLSLVETGKRGIPSPEILKKLAPVLKVTYEELMLKAGHLEDKPKDPIPGDSSWVDVDNPKDLDEFIKRNKVHFDGVPVDEEDWEAIRSFVREAILMVREKKAKEKK